MFIPGYGKKSIFTFFRRRRNRWQRLFRWKQPSRRVHGGTLRYGSGAGAVALLTLCMFPLFVLSAAGKRVKRIYRRRLRTAGKASL